MPHCSQTVADEICSSETKFMLPAIDDRLLNAIARIGELPTDPSWPTEDRRNWIFNYDVGP
jgi:hypothetical protein